MRKKDLTDTYTRSSDELRERLETLVRLAKGDAERLDSGDLDQALRLAAFIRILVHDGASPSLLTSLGIKSLLVYPDTSALFVRHRTPVFHGLTGIDLVDFVKETFVAPLDCADIHNRLSFDDWWSQVIIASGNYELTRGELVLRVCNKDGGAHVDVNLCKKYAKLAHGGEFGVSRIDELGRPLPMRGLVQTTIRQITHELFKALDINFRQYNKPGQKEEYLVGGVTLVYADDE